MIQEQHWGKSGRILITYESLHEIVNVIKNELS